MTRFASLAAAFGLIMASSCADTFGLDWTSTLVPCLHSSDCTPCLHNSDCPGNLRCISRQCAPQCVTSADCEDPPFGAGYTCGSGGTCVAFSDASFDVGVVETGAATEGSFDSAPDTKTPSECDSGAGDCNGNPGNDCKADLTSDPANCGVCGRACTSTICDDFQVCAPNVCENGVCQGLTIPGLLHTGGPYTSTAKLDQFIAYQVRGVPEGWITAFGIITPPFGSYLPDGGAVLASPHGYIGLYADAGGSPAGRVAVAEGDAEVTLKPGTSQIFSVTPPVQLTGGYYWIAILFDADVVLDATPDEVKIAAIPSSPALNPPQPLPSQAPATTVTCDSAVSSCFAPALYLVVAD